MNFTTKIFLLFCESFIIFNPFLFVEAYNVGIMGGRNAELGEIPYQVYITQQGIDSYWFLCDGIILSPSWILSSASCVNVSAPTYETLVGITNLTDSETSNANNETNEVSQFIVHPNYNSEKSLNDLSLMKLSTPLTFNAFVQPATLASSNIDSRTGVASFSGWGVMGGFNPYPDNLQILDSNILTFEECNATLQKIINDTEYNVHPDALQALDDATKICTGPLEDFKGSCFGDEGSPLTKNGVVIGIASFVIEPCGREFAPTIFTRLSAYIDWIKENVDEDIIIV